MIHRYIRRRVLIPLGLGMAVVAAVVVIGFYQYTRHDLDHELETEAASIHSLLQIEIDDIAKVLLTHIEHLELLPCARKYFAERVRPRLLDCATPYYQTLRNNQITHMYFHRPDRVNFLRMHYSPRHGDTIERQSLSEAASTGKPAHGLELGPLGHFTLRVVKPWHVDGQLLGYVELGQEIHHLAPKIKEILNTDLFMLVEKRHLTRQLWEEGQRVVGRAADWEQLQAHAVIDRTAELPGALLNGMLAAAPLSEDGFVSSRFSNADRQYEGYRLPLTDMSGQRLGYILGVKDITETLADIDRLSLLVSAVGLIVAALLFAAFGSYLGRIQHALIGTHNALEREVQEHSRAEGRLLENQARLDQEIEQRKRAAAEEHTLGVLLRLSLQPLPMENFLEQAITALVTNVPWLSLMPRGGVFLAHGENHERHLELAAEYNMSPQTIMTCGNVKFGHCHCGRAAADGKIQFANEVDERHDIRPPDIRPHGHYAIPIKHNDSVLGVVLLYLMPGHQGGHGDRSFLERVATVFSMGILRRYGEEALVAARKKAESAAKAKSNFLATMSHEIRTPLNGVLGMADLLLETGLDEDQREFAKVIGQSGRNLLAIINDILDFSKVEAERLELSPMPFNLETTIHNVVELFAAQCKDKQLEVIMDYAPDCPQYLLADAGRIRQIMLNLIGNAIKFTTHGHILIKVNGHLEDDGDWAALYISIEDSGIGFEPEAAARLFEAFSQAEAGTTRRYGGTGLGLAICKQLVELMGGEIGALGEPGKGAKFWIALTLPLAAAPQPLPKAALEGVPLLLIDAATLGHKVLCRQLEELGLRVNTAFELEQALTMLREAVVAGRPFRMTLIDHPLPQLDIEELARTIQADPALADMPLVLMSSLAYRGDARHFEAYGFAGYLAKPVQLSILCQTLSAALARGGRPPAPAPLITRHLLAEDATTPAARRRILLVDDNETNRRIALAFLQRLGVTVDSAASAGEALQQTAAGNYDLILMDLQMPEIDGYEAARLIRVQEEGKGKRTPIVALSASTLDDVKQGCEAAGMDDYLAKPYDEETLCLMVEKWLPERPVPRIKIS